MKKSVEQHFNQLSVEETDELITKDVKIKIPGKGKKRIREQTAQKTGIKTPTHRSIPWRIAAMAAAACVSLVLIWLAGGKIFSSGPVDTQSNPSAGATQKPTAAPPAATDPPAPAFISWPAATDFNTRYATFSVELFKKSFDNEKNALVSPLSVLLALAMTANGAEGETLAEMEQAMSGLPIADFSHALLEYVYALPSSDKAKLHIANSIWFRDTPELTVVEEFLRTNQDTFAAEIRKEPFDDQTVGAINDWADKHTDGMIQKIIENIDPDVMLYLINAMAFDAEWEKIYIDHYIQEGIFTAVNGKKQPTDFMHSDEGVYLSDEKATGFLKPYAGGRYAFAAVLPNEGTVLADYAAGLTGEGWINLLKTASEERVYAVIPKFAFEFELELKNNLQSVGMERAFTPQAEFGRMARLVPDGPLYIGRVIHKTFIAVDERGTRAGALTNVAIERGGGETMPKVVILDRPFLFAIVDTQAGLPIFIGAVNTISN